MSDGAKPILDEKHFARLRETQGLRPVMKQCDAQFLFEVADLPAERWLRNVEPRRRARDVLFFGWNCQPSNTLLAVEPAIP